MRDLFARLAEEMAKTKNVLMDGDIPYPITVEKFNAYELKAPKRTDNVGHFVSVRPCGKEYGEKTYLGIYLGEFPVGHMTAFNPEDKSLSIFMKKNPAMFIPDLNKIIYGMESWWTEIETEADLKKITDLDIENTWYVKVLRSLTPPDIKPEEVVT